MGRGLAALLRHPRGAGAHGKDHAEDHRDDRSGDEGLQCSAAGVGRDAEELFDPIHEFVPPQETFTASSHFARARARMPAGMFFARTCANVSATFCFVESGRLRPANVAVSIFAAAVPFETRGDATTMIGPLTMKALPVAVSVSRPGSSLMVGSVTVIPL